jgi:hypothetical protein
MVVLEAGNRAAVSVCKDNTPIKLTNAGLHDEVALDCLKVSLHLVGLFTAHGLVRAIVLGDHDLRHDGKVARELCVSKIDDEKLNRCNSHGAAPKPGARGGAYS